ncbi:recombinase family protein [Paracoccus benzoatiresistens]|uniref:Recombinase family protein n=1 Tax=Paracoccus benzoatiresistens TaxID=2997341 RepID=A0ABT4JA42_9RHOB|nr:recombinase family protein [Paracoccus sp. EF6]MCZ0963961.1 recombinase family protein [Paracoccus sp. EF6]
MALIGYARVSTLEQTLDPQLRELRAVGCDTIHEEQASGADRTRPALGRLLATIKPGDTLVVVRLDRLARSLVHLLQVIDLLKAKGAHFRSLGDPIDTTTPQGTFSLQVMGAVAELERALIRERTKAGLRSARAQGRIGGNPALRSGDRDALRKLRLARDETYARKLEGTAQTWVPLVRRHRPDMAWDDLTRLLNARKGRDSPDWSIERLKRAAKRYVRDGLLPSTVLDRAPRRDPDDRLLAIVAGMRHADPDLTLAGIATRLEQMRERTPRGNTKWYPSTVRMLLQRAGKMGMAAES